MSNPSLDSSQRAEISASSYRRANFVSVNFPSGMQAWTDIGRVITIDTVTYTPGVINFPRNLKQNTDPKPARISIELPGTDTTLRTAIQGDDFHFRRVKFYMAVLNPDNQVITGLISQGQAVLSSASLSIGENSASIVLSVESLTALLLRKRRVTATHQDQQWRYPGDFGFDHVPLVEGSEDDWGGQIVRQIERLPKKIGAGKWEDYQ